jgi:hypothetical protein
MTSLSATGISASTGASVLSFVYAPAVTVTSAANLQSLTATHVFTQSLYATAGLDLGALSVNNLQTLSVNSRTQVPSIQFTGASGSPFRIDLRDHTARSDPPGCNRGPRERRRRH